MKSKLTDEDIPDLADLMGEKHFSVYSDNLSLRGNAACIATSREWPSITLFFLYKNIFYKNIEADICEILTIF